MKQILRKQPNLFKDYGGRLLEVLQSVRPNLLRTTWAAGTGKGKKQVCAVCLEVQPSDQQARLENADIKHALGLHMSSDQAQQQQLPLGVFLEPGLNHQVPVPGTVLLGAYSRKLAVPFENAVVYGIRALQVLGLLSEVAIAEAELAKAFRNMERQWKLENRLPEEAVRTIMLEMLLCVSRALLGPNGQMRHTAQS